MKDFLRELQFVIKRLEEAERSIACDRALSLEDAVKQFTDEAGRILAVSQTRETITDFPKLGFQPRFLVLKAAPAGLKAVSSHAGEGVHRELREQMLPNVNMTQLVFSERTRIHRARFYISKTPRGKAIEQTLRARGVTPRQMLLLDCETAVPVLLRAWLSRWQEEELWSDESRIKCLGELKETIDSDPAAFERHALETYISQSAHKFTGGYAASLLQCISPPKQSANPSQEGSSIRNDSDVLWGFKSASGSLVDLELSEAGCDHRIPFPKVSRHNFWWSMYVAKCALNTDQYALFCANPSSSGDDRSGVVVITELSTKRVLQQLMAIELLANTLLSCVDRLTLFHAEQERRMHLLQAERDRQRANDHEARADLSATFSHAYVKQAAALDRVAKDIAAAVGEITNHTGLVREIQSRSDLFRAQVQIYQREMEAFAELSKGTVFFVPERSARVYNATPLVQHVFRGFALSLAVGYSKQLLPECSPRTRDTILDLLRESEGGLDTTVLRELFEKARSDVLSPATLDLLPSLEESEGVRILPPEHHEEFQELFNRTLEKAFFEVFYNAIKNWAEASEHHQELFNETQRVVRISLLSSPTIAVRIVTTGFYPASGRQSMPSEYTDFYSKHLQGTIPPKPGSGAYLGGWGLYGNVLISQLFRDASTRGSFNVQGEFPPGITKDTRIPYAFDFISTFILPPGFAPSVQAATEHDAL